MVVDRDTGARELISELDNVMLHMFNHILASGKYPDAIRCMAISSACPITEGGGFKCTSTY